MSASRLDAGLFIEQDKKQAELAFRFQCRVDIDSFRIVEASFRCKKPAEQAEFPLQFELGYRAGSAATAEKVISIPIKFEFRAIEKESKLAVVTLRCLIQANYILNEQDDEVLSAQQITAFKNGNAIFNCWPYFREFVQSSLLRMNYPPLSLPFLRLIPKLPRAIESKAEETPEAPADPKLLEEILVD